MANAEQPISVTVVPVTPFQQNCSVITDRTTKRATVVDPGGDVERILKALDDSGATAEQIVLTHGHIDHAGGAMELRDALRKTDAELEIVGPHVDDGLLLASLEQQGQAYGIAGVRNCIPDRWLAEGEVIEIAGQSFDVLHCPGHSPGSVVLVSHAVKFAISGDVLFQQSVGRSDLPGGDHATLMASIIDKLLPLGDDITFLPGHGPASTFGAERQTNPFVLEAIAARG